MYINLITLLVSYCECYYIVTILENSAYAVAEIFRKDSLGAGGEIPQGYSGVAEFFRGDSSARMNKNFGGVFRFPQKSEI